MRNSTTSFLRIFARRWAVHGWSPLLPGWVPGRFTAAGHHVTPRQRARRGTIGALRAALRARALENGGALAGGRSAARAPEVGVTAAGRHARNGRRSSGLPAGRRVDLPPLGGGGPSPTGTASRRCVARNATGWEEVAGARQGQARVEHAMRESLDTHARTSARVLIIASATGGAVCARAWPPSANRGEDRAPRRGRSGCPTRSTSTNVVQSVEDVRRRTCG